jgi:hypothetical protein
MEREKAAQVKRLTQMIVTLHRSQAKELSTGDFCKGLNAIYLGSTVEEFEQHLEDCDHALQSILSLHQERQKLLRSFITARKR